MTVTWTRLLKAQAASRAPAVKDKVVFVSADQLRLSAAAARRRLMGGGPAPLPAPPKQLTVDSAPVTVEGDEACEVQEAPAPVVDNTPFGAPLNMLAPCSWKFLRELASLRHGIPTYEIMGKNRERPVVAARYEAMALVYQHSQLSLPQVGRLFKRDHTTVLHALRKVGGTGKLVEIKEIGNQGGRPQQAALRDPRHKAPDIHKRSAAPFTVAVEGSVHG